MGFAVINEETVQNVVNTNSSIMQYSANVGTVARTLDSVESLFDDVLSKLPEHIQCLFNEEVYDDAVKTLRTNIYPMTTNNRTVSIYLDVYMDEDTGESSVVIRCRGDNGKVYSILFIKFEI